MAATALRPQSNFVIMAHTPKEASYGTVVSAGSIVDMFPLQAPTMAEFKKTRVDDMAQIKGHEFALDTAQLTTTAQDVSFPLSFPAAAETAAMLFAFGLGSVSMSGSGDPYSATITAQNGTVSDQLPSTSIVMGVKGQTGTYKEYKGCVMNEVKFGVENRGRASLTATVMSDGTETDASAFTIPSAVSATSPFWGKNATIAIGNAGSGTTDYSALLQSFDVTWNNNLSLEDAHSLIAAGPTLNVLRFGTRTCSLSIKLWGSIADSFYASDFQSDTLKDIEISVTNSANRLITFSFSRCIIDTVKPTFSSIRNVLELTIKPFVITASTGISPVSILVKTANATYL
jgi:hypothetical protein